MEGAGHQWAEPDLEGVGEEGLHHTRSTSCNLSAVVGSQRQSVGRTLPVNQKPFETAQE